MKTLKLLVSGRVQGVAYRYYTKLYADDFGLTGTVRNLRDGRVEVYVTGQEKTLSEFVTVLHKGSPYCEVRHIDSEVVDFTEFKDFQIII